MCLFIGGEARGGWSSPGQPPVRPHRRARRSPGCRFAKIGTKRSSCRIRCKDKEDSYKDKEDTYQIKPNASIRQVFCSEVAEGVAHARQAGERDRRAGWPRRAARLWKLTPRDGGAPARPDQECAGRRQAQRLPHGREPGAIAARNRPLSSMAMAMLLRRMKAALAVHGFRSTFRCARPTPLVDPDADLFENRSSAR